VIEIDRGLYRRLLTVWSVARLIFKSNAPAAFVEQEKLEMVLLMIEGSKITKGN